MTLKKSSILAVTAKAFEEPLLLKYAQTISQVMDARVIQAKTNSRHESWAEIEEIASHLSPAMIVASWPAEGRSLKEAQKAAHNSSLFLIDPRRLDPSHIASIVAPWSGNSLSLGRLRFAGRLARQLGVPGQVLRIISPDGLPAGKQAILEYVRQVLQRERLELALADVALPAQFRLSGDAVGEVLVRVKPHDMVIVGGSNDWLMEHHPAVSMSWDIHESHAGPSAMMIEPASRPISMAQVFHESSILIDDGPAATAPTALIDLLIKRRQVPWSWKQKILDKAKEISLGRRVRFVHAIVGRHGRVSGGLGISRGSAGGKAQVTFLVLVPQEGYDVYLPVLAKLAELASDEAAIDSMLESRTPAEALSVLATYGSISQTVLAT